MNTTTGAISTFYSNEDLQQAQEAARERGEEIVPVSPRVAKLMREAQDARRRRARSRRAMQKASRRANR